MRSLRRWFLPSVLGLLVVAGLVIAFRPQPVPVDLAAVDLGPMTVTVGDDGITRVREVFLISAPLPGRLLRIDGEVGDAVTAGDTVLGRILPTDPAFLDPRRRSEQEAAVRAAEAAMGLEEAEVERLAAELEYAEAEHRRALALFERDTVAESYLERRRLEERSAAAALSTAQARLRVRQSELEAAQAALMEPSSDSRLAGAHDAASYPVVAPIAGRILQVLQESESVVAAGTPLVEIGDPRDLEVVVDLLSEDAVQVVAGADAYIEQWGGAPLSGRVRRVEPFGFTKVSALGIEEQRVNVIIDFVDPPEAWATLGHGYRVDVRIVLWQSDSVLRVPVGALFRHQGDWAVFIANQDHARLRNIQIGHMNDEHAEIVGGLEDGNRVVLHPSDRIHDGVGITPRQPG